MAKSKYLKLSKRWLKYCCVLISALGITLWLGDKVFPLNLMRYQDTSTLVYGANKELLHVFLSRDEKFRIPTKQSDVTPLYVKTLLAREDRFYPIHFGVNPFSLLRAVYHRISVGHIVSGGSTLTMQTARLLEPRKRSLVAKVIECFRAIQLEWHFSKDEILNIYMTLAPFGSNIEGVKAAALTYFNKTPKTLTPPEIALLVAMVQSPNSLRPDENPKKSYKARHHILKLMQEKGLITSLEHHLHQDAPLPTTFKKFPREIPHLAWRLKQQYPKQTEIESTINLSLQKQIEHLLKSYQNFLPPQANTAILILDHAHNKPLAYVGSLDYLDPTHHGFVDYIRAYRSPGSTLKPFIYGLAFDSGLVQPDSFILDARRRFGAYYPRNFNKGFHGMVQAREALAQSLNIPAVLMLNEMGVVRFLSLLKETGVEPKFPKSIDGPGLPSALGGLGLTLEQLVLLYSSLGNQGKAKSFSYVVSDQLSKENYLFSPGAAKQVMDILAVEDGKGKMFSVKTGTSYGHRDALAIGFDQQYVVGIWIGSPSGSPMRDITGASTAVPLLQKIVQILPQQKSALPLPLAQSNLTLNKLTPSSQSAQNQETLRLLFPVDNTIIALEKAGIPCTIRGGTRPYTWLIDGKPVSQQSWQQKYIWNPEKPGYYSFTVIDATGCSVNAHVEIT